MHDLASTPAIDECTLTCDYCETRPLSRYVLEHEDFMCEECYEEHYGLSALTVWL
jgi:hypothetical protein